MVGFLGDLKSGIATPACDLIGDLFEIRSTLRESLAPFAVTCIHRTLQFLAAIDLIAAAAA